MVRLYHVVKVAYSFREANGRTQREFNAALAAESGHSVHWKRSPAPSTNLASIASRQG